MSKQKTTQQQLRAKLRWGVIGMFALLAASAAFIAPQFVNRGVDAVNNTVALGIPQVPERDFKLGLDLQGGAHLVYHADVANIPATERAAAVEGVRDVIERRVNAIGVGEPRVQTTKVGEEYRVIVELPGVTDINDAIEKIGKTPTLEFKEQNNQPARELTDAERQQMQDFNMDKRDAAEAALARIRAGEDFEAVARDLSDDATTREKGGYLGFVGPNNVPTSVYEWADSHTNAAMSDVVSTTESFVILKRGEMREGDVQVTASHILLCYRGAPQCQSDRTKEEAEQLAAQTFDEVNKSNFAATAEEISDDPGSGAQGGDLGTFGRGMMVPAFEEAVFNADSATIIGPVETRFGYHIIHKRGEEPLMEYELWQILFDKQTERDILPPQDPWIATQLSGKHLERAEVVTDQISGSVQVSLQFDSEGADLFADITKRKVGQPVGIFLDGEPISVPVVQQPILNGEAVVTGDFSITEARLLAQRLNAGALPVPVDLISQQGVGATLGAESLAQSLKAGLVGILVVMLFMVALYRLPGVISVIALTMYATITFALFKLIGVTITLAGIAGFILSIGMAVDANVLIFERLKEELREKKSLKVAIEDGFIRAWSSIRDGNVSTLITCALLIWFGTSFVQGFAITLGIGILISMFTAITVTRVFLRFVAPWFPRQGNRAFWGYTKK